MSYDNGCHLASCFHLDPADYEVVAPLVAPPSCRLVVPAGCRIASCCPLIAPPSFCRLSRCLSTHRPLVILSSCCAASHCLVAPAGYHIIISCRPPVAPPSRPLIVLAGCCVASPCAALWLLHRLSSSSHFAALLLSCCASWLWHCLSSPFHRTTLSSTRRASLLSHCLSSSSCDAWRHSLVLSSRQLVVALPLDAPPSRCLVVSLCHLLLSRCISWLSSHHLLSSSCCTALLSCSVAATKR